MVNDPLYDINCTGSFLNIDEQSISKDEIIQLFPFQLFLFFYFSSLFLYLALLFCDLTIHQYISVLFILRVHLIHEL